MYFWPRLLNCQTEKVPIQIDFSRTLPNSSKGINYFPKPNTKKLPSLDLKGKCTGLLYYTQHAVFIIVKSTMNSKAGNADVRGWRSSLPLSCQVNFCGCHLPLMYISQRCNWVNEFLCFLYPDSSSFPKSHHHKLVNNQIWESSPALKVIFSCLWIKIWNRFSWLTLLDLAFSSIIFCHSLNFHQHLNILPLSPAL